MGSHKADRPAGQDKPAALSRAQRKTLETNEKPFTVDQLNVIRRDAKQTTMTKRLLKNIDELQARLDAQEANKPGCDQLEPHDLTVQRAEGAFATGDHVLICYDTATGLCDVYAEPWVKIHHVEVKPWEDFDADTERLADRYFGLWSLQKRRVRTIHRTVRTVDEAVEWLVKCESWQKFIEYRDAGKLPELAALVAKEANHVAAVGSVG